MTARITFGVVCTTTALFFSAGGCSGKGGFDEPAAASAPLAMSTTIETVYGLTSFGGSGDCQPFACTGANSCSSQPWYSASSQRYGCGVHLQVVAGSKCVVVLTQDAGPASWVEADAGIAILDASPAVGEYLFGQSSLGWSDNKDNPGVYDVHVTVTSQPVGPCGGSSSGGSSSDAGGGGGGGGGGGSSSDAGGGGGDDGGWSGGDAGGSGDSGWSDSGGFGDSGGGTACGSDGDCNPGSDGSGLICVGGTCVPGCDADWECPGIETCVSGNCE
jgi:hypothetical protein